MDTLKYIHIVEEKPLEAKGSLKGLELGKPCAEAALSGQVCAHGALSADVSLTGQTAALLP